MEKTNGCSFINKVFSLLRFTCKSFLKQIARRFTECSDHEKLQNGMFKIYVNCLLENDEHLSRKIILKIRNIYLVVTFCQMFHIIQTVYGQSNVAQT